MKITKCPKTLTGKHYWPEWVTRQTNYWPQCWACGMIDDREVKKIKK